MAIAAQNEIPLSAVSLGARRWSRSSLHGLVLASVLAAAATVGASRAQGAATSDSAPPDASQPAAEKPDALVEVVSRGLKGAFDMQSQRLTLDQAENTMLIKKAALLPTLALSAGKSLSGTDSVNSDGSTGYTNADAPSMKLTASWTIWDNYSTIRNAVTGAIRYDGERINSRNAAQKYVLSLLGAYLTHQYNVAKREIDKGLYDQAKHTFDESALLMKAGARTQLDAMDAEIDLLNAEKNLRDDDTGIVNSERSLRFLINWDSLSGIPRVDLMTLDPYYMRHFEDRLANLRKTWESELALRNPDLQYSRSSLEAASQELAQTKLSYFPTTGIALTHNWTFDSQFQPSPSYGSRAVIQDWSIAFTLSWKLWDWWATPMTVASARMSFDQQRIAYLKSELDARTSLANQIAQLDSLKQTIAAQRLTVEKANKQLEFSTEMYRLGRVTLLQQQQSQSRVAAAQLDLAGRLKDYALNAAAILYAMGYDLAPEGATPSWARGH